MPTAAPLSEEHQRRVAAVIALVREIADVISLEDLVSALLQAAAVWYDIDARGFRRRRDGNFELAAILPGVAAPESCRLLPGEVVAGYPALTRVSAAADLEAFGSHETSGDLLVLPLPAGGDPLWVLTFAAGAVADAEPVLHGLSPLLDMLVDRWRLKQQAALHARVLNPMARGLAAGDDPVALAIGALRSAFDAGGARLSIVHDRGATQVIASAGTVPDVRGRSASAGAFDVATVSVPLGAGGTAVLELSPASALGEAGAAAFAAVARDVLVPWLSGALSGSSLLAMSAPHADIADLTPRIRDEIVNAARFGRGTAILSIAFVGGTSPDGAAVDAARRGAATAITRELRRDDAVGRIAGADLAVLVTDVTPDALPHASERVRRVLASAHLAGRAPAAVIGSAVFPADGIFADQLMDVARGHAARQIAAMDDTTWGRDQA